MPGSGAVPTSHSSTVSFAGTDFGRLTAWRLLPGTAQFEDTTNITSDVVGTGNDARIIRQVDCTAIDPGGADLTLFGCPPLVTSDLGTRGTLEVTFSDGAFALDAYLESFDVSASVGEMLVGTIRFRFTGRSE